MVRIFRNEPDDGQYHQLYGYDLKTQGVGEVIRYVNYESPPGWIFGQIEKGDIIEINKTLYTVLASFDNKYVCAKWEDTNKYTLVAKDIIRGVIVRPRQAAYSIEIVNKLEVLQSTVGGLLEAFMFDKGMINCIAYVNDEGILLNLEPNRFIEDTVIFGNMFIIGDKDGEDISLTAEEENRYLKLFSEIYSLKYDPETGTLFII